MNPIPPASPRRRSAPSSFSLPRFVLTWLVIAPVAVLPPHVRAGLPTGANVVHGTVGIAQAGNAMTLTQASRHAIVNWQSFNVGAGESLRLVQSGADAAMLARVTGGDPSALLGSLQADGKLFLINSKGIVVGRDAVIDTAGFMASTLDVSDGDFLRGTNLTFKGDSAAGIVNLGTIAAREGNVLLFAHVVKNAGSIAAPKGTAGLGAGTEVHLASAEAPSFSIKVNLGSTTEKIGVENSGVIAAAQAELKAAGGSIYELAVNQSGIVRATGIENKNGRVLLTAAGGTVGVSGDVKARNADGAGGEILVGGDYRGGNPDVPNASRTVVTATAYLDASSVPSVSALQPFSPSAFPSSGRVIVWADDATRFLGTIDARGDGGGFAEVSGKRWLDFNPSAPVRLGTGGTLLLDPDALVVSTDADSGTSTSGADPFVFGATTEPATLNVTTLQNQLALSNVTLDTSTSAGDITVAAPVTWATNNTLRLQAGGSINLNASLTGGATSTLALFPGRNATPSAQGLPILNNRATLAGGATISVGTLAYGANALSSPPGYTIDAPASVAPLTLNGNVSVGTLEIDLDGGAAGVTTNGSNNAISAFRTTGTGTLSGAYVVDHQGGLDVTIDSVTAEGPYLQFITPGTLTLKSGSSLNFATSGTVLLASTGDAFVNEAGGSVFGGNVRFLVYSSSPGATAKGGLTGADVFSHAFDIDDDFSGDTLSRFLFNVASGLPFLTYTADNASRAYGASDPAFSATVTGLQQGITNDVTGSPTFSTAATQSSGVGGYTLTVARGTLASSNYDFTFVAGTLNVTATAPLTISANSDSRIYGVANPAFSASYTGFVGDDDASLVSGLQFSTAATQSSGVGAYAITPFGASATGYSVSYQSGLLSILQAPLTLSVASTSRAYGDANPAFAIAYDGLVNGDTAAAVSGLGVTTAATPASNVGNYPVSLSGASAANYSIDYLPGTLAVTPAPLTVAIDAKTRVYGDANPALTYTVDGLKNGETAASAVSVSGLAALAAPTTGIGAYGILGTAFLNSSNYTVTTHTGTLTITPRPLTIAANDATRIYGDPNPAFSATLTGLVNGDTNAVVTSLNFIPSGGLLSGVGHYAITPTGTTSANYTPVFAPGTLSITPATLTGSIDHATRLYGDENPAFSFSNVVGFKNSDSLATLTGVSPAIGSPATPASNVGSYAITGSAVADNYVIALTPATLAVTPAPLTVTVANANRTYGQANPAFSVATIDGFRNDDTSSLLTGLSLSTVATAASNAGNYAIDGTATATNYAVTFVPGRLSVGRASATITAGSGNRAFGDTLALIPGFFGFLPADEPLARSTWISTPDSATFAPGLRFVGFAETQPAVGAVLSQNYLITFVTGSLFIGPRPVDVTAPGAVFTVGALPASFPVTAPAPLAGGPAYTVVARANATNASFAGAYLITPEIVPGAGVTRAELDRYYTFKLIPGQLSLTQPTTEIDPSFFTPKTLTPLKTTTLTPEEEKKLTTDLSTKITVVAPTHVAYDTPPLTLAEYVRYFETFPTSMSLVRYSMTISYEKFLTDAGRPGTPYELMPVEGRKLLDDWMHGRVSDAEFQARLADGSPGAREAFAYVFPTLIEFTLARAGGPPEKLTDLDRQILGRLADLTELQRAETVRIAERKYEEMLADYEVKSKAGLAYTFVGRDFKEIVEAARSEALSTRINVAIGVAVPSAIAGLLTTLPIVVRAIFPHEGGFAGAFSGAAGVPAVVIFFVTTLATRSIQIHESLENEAAFNAFITSHKIDQQITSLADIYALDEEVKLSKLILAAEFLATASSKP